MNKKYKILGAAGSGVLALSLLGGGTYALWSDYETITGNSANGGKLTLFAEKEAMGTDVLAPGENKIVYRYVASRSDQTAALENARLELTFDNVKSHEDGCTSNTEKDDEIANSYAQTCDSNGGAAYTQSGTGHFADQAYLQVRAGNVLGEDACDESAATSPITDKTLANWDTAAPVVLGHLNPDEGICVVFEFGLPDTDPSSVGIDFANADTDNAVQGDSATFDVRFDLIQELNNA